MPKEVFDLDGSLAGVIRDDGTFQSFTGTPAPTPQTSNPTTYDPISGKPQAGTGPDPRGIALKRAQQRLASGSTWDVAAGGMVADLASAALRGDGRVLCRDFDAEQRDFIQAQKRAAEQQIGTSHLNLEES